MKHKRIFILKLTLIFITFCLAQMKTQPYHQNFAVPYTASVFENDSSSVYSGGDTKSLIRFLVPSQQSHKIPNKLPQIPSLFNWAKLDNFLLQQSKQNPKTEIDNDPWFAMKPRKTGILHSLETSEWYQKLASHCVDWSPDSYSWNGFLCSGVTDFGINLFIEAIAFKDLVVCAILGYATGDSLFCLTLYLTRFILQDYIPDDLKEEYHYTDGRMK